MKKLRKSMKIPQSIDFRNGWNIGGKLHNATISQWHSGDFYDGLATCSDWVTAIAQLDGTPSVDDNGKPQGNYRSSLAPLQADQLFGLSIQLFQALTIGTEKHVALLASEPASKWVFICAAKLGWLKVEET